MSTEAAPEWDLSDRLRKALRHAKVETQEMADYLGVSRTSVSNWMNGHNRPSRPALRVWALRCGVPFSWLAEGDPAPNSGNRSFPTTQPSLWLAA